MYYKYKKPEKETKYLLPDYEFYQRVDEIIKKMGCKRINKDEYIKDYIKLLLN